MSSLSDKLKSLGVKVGAQDLPPPRRRAEQPIEQVIAGKFLDTLYGPAYIVETLYPFDHRQGLVGISLGASLRTVADWIREPRLLESDPRSLVFLDTETTGLAGGAGTFVFLVGVGRFEEGGFRLAQFFLRDPIEELAYLAALNGFLGTNPALVTFNGRAFDVPLLNARFITNGEASPLNGLAHIDLLPLARRLWRDRLPSRALGFLEEHILGARRTEEDVPGWLIPSLYFDYLRTGDARPLKSVFYHNAMDVLSMAALLNHVAGVLENPFESPQLHGIDLVSLARLYEEMGQADLAARCYAGGLAGELPEEIRCEAEQRWSLMEKRRENLPAAVEIWRQAASRNEIYAFVELAKFYEHRLRDYPQAIHWTESAIALVRSRRVSRLERERWLPELEHRLARLRRKSASRQSPGADLA